MENTKLNPATIKAIESIKNALENIILLESNIEVVWELEKLHHQQSLLKASELIRQSL
tara:strand:- start:409 stop:582 length:174 start_codon:yes stop_codon:yes gene_type:complete